MYWSSAIVYIYYNVMLSSRRAAVKIGMRKKSYLLSDIISKTAVLENYICDLNSKCPAPLHEVANHANIICEDLKKLNNSKTFKASDKGAMGKYVEASIFGISHNTRSMPDLSNGYDIKTMHLFNSSKKNNLYVVKDRLTITNCGTKNNYSSFHRISTSPLMIECAHYNKIQKGVLFVFQYESTLPQDKRLLTVFSYDIEKMPHQDIKTMESDYSTIRHCILNGSISQRKQKYLHIHRHGTKKYPNTCALGFTGKFLIKLINIFGGKKLVVAGRANYIEM